MTIRQITVFGGSGFVGRAIVQALAREGYMIRVAVRRIGLANGVKAFGDVGQINLMQANLRMPASIALAVAGSDAVVNAAGIPFPRGRQTYQAVHADGARHIADACRAAGVKRLIHISGIGADNRSSRNAYIKSKVAAEDAIVGGFTSATILRPSVVFGPNDVLFTRLAGIASTAPIVPLIGDGSARVQPVFSADVGRAVVAALKRPDTARTVFELGGPRIYSYREIARLVLLEIDRRKPIVGVPAPLMKLAGFFAQQIGRLGLTPPLTADQVELMCHDNIVRPGANTFAMLGIEPAAPEAILPTYLDRFRVGGRYNQHAPA
ncbi:MAG: complex I NDUFA9 subunit family protein [Alphaproteobacteria bacterium]|nr:MAG: complex I NDUFA9 subunit family protein [Alphaproteobacteria bacterium]